MKLPNRLHRAASLHRKGHAPTAVREYKRHLAAHPRDKVGHYHLALAFEDSGKPEAALHAYNKALEIDSYYPEALNNLGILLHKAGNLDAARLCYARALAARPDYIDAEYNYATAESDSENYSGALLHFSRVLERDPSRADAWTNLAKVFLALRSPAEARRACDAALQLQPGSRDAAWNHGIAALTQGDLLAGWKGFEFRGPTRHPEMPRWHGEPLEGKRLLIHAEQGFGDTLQFVRYCSQVSSDYTLEVQPELAHLLHARPFQDHWPEIACQIPLMSLGEIFSPALDAIPSAAYLTADTALTVEWNRRMVTPDHSLRVGLIWSGNPKHRNDKNRSLDPVLLKPLAAVEDISFFCLQQQPQSAPAYLGVLPFVRVFDQLTWPDTAAILTNLDLLISVDTAAAHLAGALGRPVWNLLPYSPDWRWMLDRSDTPWYPSMRLFRQPRMNDWPSVVAEVLNALRTYQK